MNKINPLVLFMILLFLLVVTINKKNNLKDEVKMMQKDTIIFEQEAKNIVNLRNNWDKTNLEQRVKNIFQAPEISGKINIIDKNSFFEVKGTNLTEKEINDLIRKALNLTFEIQKIELAKLSQNDTSLLLEIVK